MPLLLVTSRIAKKRYADFTWFALFANSDGLSERLRLTGVAELLEAHCDQSVEDTWVDLARHLSQEKGASLSHTTTCAFNASDFGQILTWMNLLESLSAQDEQLLCICDDPWIFRHLQSGGMESSGPAPGLILLSVKLYVRGYLARIKKALSCIRTRLVLSGRSREFEKSGKALMVYGHPDSTADDRDGYFGSLMHEFPELTRVIHTDFDNTRADIVQGKGRTFSLHAWGSLWFALILPFVKWRPPRGSSSGSLKWLVKRAVQLEGGTAQAAAIAWQVHCQKNWLEDCRPILVLWPWENHSWEREFVRCARNLKVRLVGYQHSVIGAQMYNYGYRSNPDGLSSIPDLILAAGPATAKALAGLGYPTERIKIGGARRLKTFEKLPFDPDAPIYVALPFDRDISREMLVSLDRLTGGEKEFLVKPHPMTPQDFRESDRVHRTAKPLVAAGPLSGVFYAATTVGLEAYLAGLPTVRFLPSSKVAVNIFPTGADVVSATGETLSEDSFKQIVHRAMSYPDIFPEPDQHVWRGVIEG